MWTELRFPRDFSMDKPLSWCGGRGFFCSLFLELDLVADLRGRFTTLIEAVTLCVTVQSQIWIPFFYFFGNVPI